MPIDILIDQYRTGRSPHRHKHACEERWAPPLGLGLWIALCAVVGLAVPLNHPNVSPHVRVAVWVLFIATEVFLALTHFLDPGIIVPEKETDPVVAQLEEREKERRESEAAGRTESAGDGLGASPSSLDGPTPELGGVRRDPGTGQWARMPSRTSNARSRGSRGSRGRRGGECGAAGVAVLLVAGAVERA